jgi:hypothetical protein
MVAFAGAQMEIKWNWTGEKKWARRGWGRMCINVGVR